ncbi:YcfL family protein [Providencia manganoxydans]|uniref:YcfL family protein n=1 Tax=Providencia manganoxydans TaxID=2923283 RepID=A0ABX7AJB7_9GAMM|nr:MULTISPECIES: YcfL family protein [Providencia]MDX4945091.1 YcfL family protein [Providencia manganoxydans]QQO64043.1 YcfL family protein [Providencia manganoxydans]
MKRPWAVVTRCLVLSTILLSLSGCIWGKRDGLVFNEQQSVIMEPSVLAHGVIVEQPVVTIDNYATVARINMSNSQPKAVTVMYRLYWYDDKGLKVVTSHDLQQLIPANSSMSVNAQSTSPLARNVRIYVFLPQVSGEK